MKKADYIKFVKEADSYTDAKGQGFRNGILTCAAYDPQISFDDFVEISDTFYYLEDRERGMK